LDESTNLADGYKSYASLKLYQEQQFKTLAHEEGLSLAVVRAYSLSGSEMCYPEKYALGSFIMSALKKEPIKISSSTPTYRGYCDAESIFLTAAKTLENQKNIEFDSFGPIVEMRELAQEVNKVLENKKPIVDDALPMRPGDRNNYYSTDTTMMHLMESLSIARLELRDQIKLTASGLLCSLDGR
jgi:nucleoside-diphosphate-sugar epimerase